MGMNHVMIELGGSRIYRAPSIAFLLLTLCVCTVRVPIESAVVRDAAIIGEQTKTVGRFQIELTISRQALERIATLQMYPHIYLVGCRDGEKRVSAEALLDGRRMEDFSRLRRTLAKSKAKAFTIAGSFEGRLEWASTCATLRGGSYAMQKLRSAPVPVRYVSSRR
jgi:hypothetical protein